MKKFRLILLPLAICLLLAGCGKTDVTPTITKLPSSEQADTGETFTVTFDTNGGSAAATQRVARGKKATDPESVREGFVCVGWYTAEGEPWAFDFHTVERDVTLKAVWQSIYLSISENGVVTGVTDDGKTAAVIVIPDESDGVAVTGIGDLAFARCTNLETLIISGTVKSIGEQAFRYCTNLTSVTLEEGVESLGWWAFDGCTALADISLPNSLTYIGSHAIPDDHEIDIRIANHMETPPYCDHVSYTVYDNANYLGNEQNPYVLLVKVIDTTRGTCVVHPNTKLIYSTAFYSTQIARIVIPDGVKFIGDAAFRIDTSLTELTLGEGLEMLDSQAFYWCSGLTTLTLPDSLTSIGKEAFFHCTGLTTLVLPDNVTTIGEIAFSECTGLGSVSIGNGVTAFYDGAFSGCMALTNITFRGTRAEWNAIEKAADWDADTGAYTVHCTDGDIAKT